uniref:TMhelix containing protein n=1 Tax=Peronospora matthiolae TaxID=2874970 RepID=A0AAV1TCB4_9STRA
MHKYTLGVKIACSVGVSVITITGTWLFRGDSEKHMIKAIWMAVLHMEEE